MEYTVVERCETTVGGNREHVALLAVKRDEVVIFDVTQEVAVHDEKRFVETGDELQWSCRAERLALVDIGDFGMPVARFSNTV